MAEFKLRHGVMIPPYHDLDENPTLTFARDLELIELLEQLDYQEVWVGEHHTAGFENISSPELIIAAAAQRTKSIRLGTGVVTLPYHHPLNVAERIIQLDHMTRGRIMFGAGPGLLPSDAYMYGVEVSQTRTRMEQSLRAIVRLFRGEVVTEQTDWYTLREARIHNMPYQHPHPEVAVASVMTPTGGRLAGELGLSMLCMATNDPNGFNALDGNWKLANETAAQHGHTMDRSRLRLMTPIYIAETREKAREDVRWRLQSFVDYMNTKSSVNAPAMAIPKGEDPLDWIIRTGWAVVGTPEDAIARIEQLQAKQGAFGCLLMLGLNWANWENTKRSYELYARYVMPHFSKANTNRIGSLDWCTENREEFSQNRAAAVKNAFDKHEAEQTKKLGAS